MFNLFKKKKNIEEISKQELQKNIEVINSLKEYDEGKKEISTTEIERRLPNIRTTTSV